MKGVELPVNVLVLIAIAVIVLLAVIVLFFGSFSGPSSVVTLQTVTSTACAEWRNRNFPDAYTVTILNFDSDKDGKLDPGQSCNTVVSNCQGDPAATDNLETLGECYYNTGGCAVGRGTNEQSIRTRVCGFP